MTARDYHNEIEPYAADWIENLIAEGLLPPGDVDRRSIVDVHPDDLKGYTRCHFFAGLGGWPLALKLAGWPDDRPVWTGSCPCQPFSVTGRQTGFADKRHLWPEFSRLIEKRLPPVVFGEQSAAATDWLRLVRGDLETMGYAVGAIPVEAASAGAEDFRDRYWFVADYDYAERRPDDPARHNPDRQTAEQHEGAGDAPERGPGALVDAESVGWGEGWTEAEFRSRGFTAAVTSFRGGQYVECPDGKWRALPPPRVRWLADGVPARVAKLRALGNAIDPRPAAAVIGAFLDMEN